MVDEHYECLPDASPTQCPDIEVQPCMLKRVATFLMTIFLVSRPGLWHFTGFLYIIPAAADPNVLLTRDAILGLLFCVLPVNLLVYSLNDLKDVDIDSKSTRRGGLHGAQACESDLQICVGISVFATYALPPLLIHDLTWCFEWSCVVFLVNWLYNFGPTLSRVPVLDMVCPLGYLSIIPFGAKMFGFTSHAGPWFVAYLALGIFRTQLWFQRFDLETDEEQDKRTTAVMLGRFRATVMLLCILVCEVGVASMWGCPAGQAWSFYCICVLAIEIFLSRKTVTLALMALSGLFIIPFFPCLAAAWHA